jgi:hypothetical protein
MNYPKNSLKVELGYSGTNTKYGMIRADEFTSELKGTRGIKKYREMRDGDATIGSIMYATEQVLRDVPRIVVPSDKKNAKSVEMAKWLETVFDDMEHTLDDHISEALSSLTFGFALFEPVYKIRGGPDFVDLKRKSKFKDGHYGIRKISSRAQWTIDKFEVDDKTGDCLGVYQLSIKSGSNFIPKNKLVHYRTTTVNNDPSGRSILRNAYKSYVYLNTLQVTEGIAIERELNGIPVVRIPSDYLSDDATDEQKSIRMMAEAIGRDLKLNEQGAIVIPSDIWVIDDKASNQRVVDVELIASKGTRNIAIDPVIRRYQHDIARSVMAEFLMLGSSTTGSYALSKSKTDLFLRSVESYINTIYDVINQQLVRPLWEINGFDISLMPKVIAGDVAPHDLDALGSYIRNINGADIDLTNQIEIINALLNNAELPLLDVEKYEQSLQDKREAEQNKRKEAIDAIKQPTETRKSAV